VRRHLAAVGLPTGLDTDSGRLWNPASLLAHMRRDKKVKDGRVTFVLARGIGQAFVSDQVDVAAVDAMLTAVVAA
jgi:3-dehydroquinate synthase